MRTTLTYGTEIDLRILHSLEYRTTVKHAYSALYTLFTQSGKNNTYYIACLVLVIL